MKKLIILAFLCSMSSALLAQNTNVNEELLTLKKQVLSLNTKNSRLEKNLKDIKISSQKIQDSLIARINENNLILSKLHKSLKARDYTIIRTKSRTELILHSLRTRKVVFYIIAPLLGFVLIGMYWQLSKNLKTESHRYESLVSNLAQTLDDEVIKTKKEFQSELTDHKEAVEKKLAEIKEILRQNLK
jgi:hypothetical protein